MLFDEKRTIFYVQKYYFEIKGFSQQCFIRKLYLLKKNHGDSV